MPNEDALKVTASLPAASLLTLFLMGPGHHPEAGTTLRPVPRSREAASQGRNRDVCWDVGEEPPLPRSRMRALGDKKREVVSHPRKEAISSQQNCPLVAHLQWHYPPLSTWAPLNCCHMDEVSASETQVFQGRKGWTSTRISPIYRPILSTADMHSFTSEHFLKKRNKNIGDGLRWGGGKLGRKGGHL